MDAKTYNEIQNLRANTRVMGLLEDEIRAGGIEQAVENACKYLPDVPRAAWHVLAREVAAAIEAGALAAMNTRWYGAAN